MPRHSFTVTASHDDGSECPPGHLHTRGGKSLTAGCPCRRRFRAVCSCGWGSTRSSTKAYAIELGKHHRTETDDSRQQAPAALRDLLRLDLAD